MIENERRREQRYALHYPVIICSSRAIDRPEGWHYGEILDAGKNGMRLRVDDFGTLPVGSELQMVCQPARNRQPNNRCMPVPIKGRVVWKNAAGNQFALKYFQ